MLATSHEFTPCNYAPPLRKMLEYTSYTSELYKQVKWDGVYNFLYSLSTLIPLLSALYHWCVINNSKTNIRQMLAEDRFFEDKSCHKSKGWNEDIETIFQYNLPEFRQEFRQEFLKYLVVTILSRQSSSKTSEEKIFFGFFCGLRVFDHDNIKKNRDAHIQEIFDLTAEIEKNSILYGFCKEVQEKFNGLMKNNRDDTIYSLFDFLQKDQAVKTRCLKYLKEKREKLVKSLSELSVPNVNFQDCVKQLQDTINDVVGKSILTPGGTGDNNTTDQWG